MNRSPAIPMVKSRDSNQANNLASNPDNNRGNNRGSKEPRRLQPKVFPNQVPSLDSNPVRASNRDKVSNPVSSQVRVNNRARDNKWASSPAKANSRGKVNQASNRDNNPAADSLPPRPTPPWVRSSFPIPRKSRPK